MVTNATQVASQDKAKFAAVAHLFKQTVKPKDKYLTFQERVDELSKLGKPSEVRLTKSGKKITVYKNNDGVIVGCTDVSAKPKSKSMRTVSIGNLTYIAKSGADKISGIFDAQNGITVDDYNNNGLVEQSEIFNLKNPMYNIR